MNYHVSIHSVTSQVYEMKCLCDCKYFEGDCICHAQLEQIGQCPWDYPLQETVTVYVDDTGDENANFEEAALSAENWLFLHRWAMERQVVFVSLYEITSAMQMEENGVEPLFDMETTR